MFKVGDKVVCINNKKIMYSLGEDNRLIKNKVYTVSYAFMDYIAFDEFEEDGFDENRFVLLSDFRKQKLKKICSRLDQK